MLARAELTVTKKAAGKAIMLDEIRELVAEPRGRPAGSGGGAYPPESAAASCPATASGSGTAA